MQNEIRFTSQDIVVCIKDNVAITNNSIVIKKGYIDKIHTAGNNIKSNWVLLFRSEKFGLSTDHHFYSTSEYFRTATAEEILKYRKLGAHIIDNTIEDIKANLDKLEKILT